MEDNISKSVELNAPVVIEWNDVPFEYIRLLFTRYIGGELAVLLEQNPAAGEDYIHISIAIPDSNLAKGEFCLNHDVEKDVLDIINYDLELFEPTGRTVRSGFVDFPVVKLTEKYMKYI